MSERLLAAFPVNIVPAVSAACRSRNSPAGRHRRAACADQSPRRAFYSGAIHVSRIESIRWPPGKFRVVSPDYRQATSTIPARARMSLPSTRNCSSAIRQSHRNLWRFGRWRPDAQATAWIIDHGLPAPAPSAFSVPHRRMRRQRLFRRRQHGTNSRRRIPGTWRAHRSATSPIQRQRLSRQPAIAPKPSAKFPPTLLITGTRAFDMSPPSPPTRAGTGWCRCVAARVRWRRALFYYDASVPRCDAYRTIVRFFRSIWRWGEGSRLG